MLNGLIIRRRTSLAHPAANRIWRRRPHAAWTAIPNLSGPWTGRSAVFRIPEDALTATSKALIHEREENYFKDRPAYQCQPLGPETLVGWRRIIQTPSLIAFAYETLTYRLIFMDG